MKSNGQKLSCNQVREVKAWVKNNLQSLPDYTPGEEKFLICDATELTQAQLLVLQSFEKKDLNKIKHFVKKRQRGMPLNKISKKAYFYGEEFFVNNHVLSPRKETEILVELVLNFVNTLDKSKTKNAPSNANHKSKGQQMDAKKTQILDLCCGSGAIGLTLAKHAKKSFVTLSDVSTRALNVAKKNAKKLDANQNTKIIKGNLFKGLKRGERFDIIVCNPPYIVTKKLETLQEGVKKYEPTLALDGGEDGLRFYKQIALESPRYLNEFGKIYLEIGFDQKEDVCQIFSQSGFSAECVKDYSGLDRIVVASFKS